MEPCSSRSRIDQFFTSKKRKITSPGIKPAKKAVKDTRVEGQNSPNAKGNLSKFLTPTQEETFSIDGKPLEVAPNAGRVTFLHTSERCQNTETNRKETSQGSSNAAFRQGESGQRPSSNRSELKLFANDFLSLYCSELKSTATSPPKPEILDQRKQGSPQHANERLEMSSSIQNPVKRNLKSAYACERTVKDMQSVIETIPGTCFGNEVPPRVSDAVEPYGTLRKCNKVRRCIRNFSEYATPGAIRIKPGSLKTPISGCGSSGSPGDNFWSEAIQVADGLLDKDSVALVTVNKTDGDCCKHDNKTEHSTSAMLRSESMISCGKEASPFPIKNLNFLLEGADACTNPDPSFLVELDGAHILHKHRKDDVILSVERNGQDPQKDNVEMFISNSDIPLNGIENQGLAVSSKSLTPESPSNCMLVKDNFELSYWLPPEVCRTYEKKGIRKLYPWQVECLQIEGVLRQRNLVYCASTSAGKSFVAEILMLRKVMSTGKIALFVLPYVSICTEKAEHFERLLEPLGKHVRSYFGNQGGAALPKDTSVAVCTIEKANSLINKLLEESRLSEIGIIVIDELHMVGDPHRGYLLELLLTKLRYASGECSSESNSGGCSSVSSKSDSARGVQIVGMSATMPNVATVADWLQAALYQTDFRPVPLEEFVKVGNTIYDRKMNIVRSLPKSADLNGKDPDHIVELCNEIVEEGHSVLIFCSCRKGCESTAIHVSKFLKKFSSVVINEEDISIASATEALKKSPAGLDSTLEQTLPSGVAYHHAGLTVEEREVVENCYRKGLVRVLTATSTLAAGVNLPARRVIFRQPRIARDFIDGTRYKQMAGRAGRTGIDTKGESVMVCKKEEFKRVMGILNESSLPLQSCLSEDKNGMTHAILEVVAGKIVQTADDVHRYVLCTLLNFTNPFMDVVKSAQESLRWLCCNKFIQWDDTLKVYSVTPLGCASSGSSLSPDEALTVLEDLSRAREGFVLASDLHLVYLVTPINVDVEPDWELYYQRYLELSKIDQSVGNRVGVTENLLLHLAHNPPTKFQKGRANKKSMRDKMTNQLKSNQSRKAQDEAKIRQCKRFYVALMLARLVQETPVAEVCEAFSVARGMVQMLQENAGRFASMVSVFCERIGWHDFEGLVAKFQNRVSFGVRAEIVELTNIPFVKGSRARSLYKAGLRSPLAVAEASVYEIYKAIFDSSTSDLQERSLQKRIYLGVAKKIKNGAQKIVLDKAEEARIAAFSAFESLGLNVPQFTLPSLPCVSDANSFRSEKSLSNISQNVLHKIESSACRDVTSIEKNLPELNDVDPEIKNIKSDVPSLSTAEHEDVKIKSSTRDVLATENQSPELKDFGPVNIFLKSNLPSSPDAVELEESKKVSQLEIECKEPEKPAAYVEHKIGQDGYSNLADILSGSDAQIKGIQNSCMEAVNGGNNSMLACKSPSNASCAFGGIDSFLNIWGNVKEFFFDIHCTKHSDSSDKRSYEIRGLAISWDGSGVHYVSIPKDLINVKKNGAGISDYCLETLKNRWNRILEIMGKDCVRKFTWNLKFQIQVLMNAAINVKKFGRLKHLVDRLRHELVDNYYHLPPMHIRAGIDMAIVLWILSPDEGKRPKLEKEVKKKLSVEAIAAVDTMGRWKNQMRSAAHNGCCYRVAQTQALHSVLWKLILSENLLHFIEHTEMPLVTVLADMDLRGIGVNFEGCLSARKLVGQKLRLLEKEAYELTGLKFSMCANTDIADVLYKHLKLPEPEVRTQWKHHPSTNKHSLELLKDEHPVIPVIKEHRTLAKLMNVTLKSICSLSTHSAKTNKYSLHGVWLQTSTSTGRLSMEDPNVQCVEHMIEFKMSVEDENKTETNHLHQVNARDLFIPTQDNWVILTADYSQIELRLMAHFSGDSSLIDLLSKKDGDAFTSLTARWVNKPEESITAAERNLTKRVVYGIIYGIGANTLAEQLKCTPEEASGRIKFFKSSFPGVASWLRQTISSCNNSGYVETLKGRKRFLSNISNVNKKEKSKAQRQAVNSICQGSAADLIKIAMVNLYSVIGSEITCQPVSSFASGFYMLKDRCHILLQVHDELVLEVEASLVKEAATFLKYCMESAASLLVPLRVKMNVGKTWGSLEPYILD